MVGETIFSEQRMFDPTIGVCNVRGRIAHVMRNRTARTQASLDNIASRPIILVGFHVF